LENFREDNKLSLESLKNKFNEHGLSSYLPQLTFYKIHGITYKENFHSKFLAFLLNPEKQKKKHGCDSIFLDIFIKILKKRCKENPALSSLNPDNFDKAITEIGSEINRKQISGGRLDICICKTFKDKDKKIIIENKITAKDQWAQLLRISRTYPGSTIVYLTPLGKSASLYSLIYQNERLEEKDYIRLSYKDDIKEWLDLCLKYIQGDTCKLNKEQIDKLSILLKDYLTVIKELTYKEEKKDDVLDILSENLNTVRLVFENPCAIIEMTGYKNIVTLLKKYIVRKKLLKKIIKTIGNDLKYKISEGKMLQKGWGFQFYKTNWQKDNIEISFYFKNNNLEDCNFCLRKYNSNDETIPEYFLLEFKNRKSKSGYYLDKENKLGQYSNWDDEIFYEILSDRDIIDEISLYKLINTIVEEMCEEIDNAIIKYKS